MKTFFNWNLLLGLPLVLSSAAFYLIHFLIKYMRHLKDNYPYLFSLALRVNLK